MPGMALPRGFLTPGLIQDWGDGPGFKSWLSHALRQAKPLCPHQEWPPENGSTIATARVVERIRNNYIKILAHSKDSETDSNC